MDIYAVMQEVEGRLKGIPGLRTVTLGAEGPVTPPCAVIYAPDRIDFDRTAGRGLDRVTDLVVVVFVGKSNQRSAVKALMPYLAGDGPVSIKRRLDSSVARYSNCADLQVAWAEIDYTARIGNTDYLAALFHINFAGAGAGI